MACVVSISFSMPLCARKFSIQKLQLRGVPLAGLSSQATIRTATNLPAFYHSNRDIFSVSSSSGNLTPIFHCGLLNKIKIHCCRCVYRQSATSNTLHTGYEARYRDPVVGVHGNSTHENNSMSRKPSLYSTALILLVLELAGFHIQFIKKTIVLCLIGIVLVGMF